ncbi:MAG: peptidoglycan DD-metalloendopeptidase family protein [Thermoanaerobaculia bacterium]
MRKLRAAGARLGGVLRASRAYYAVVPLAIPVLFFSLVDRPAVNSPMPPASTRLELDFVAAETVPSPPLPNHVAYLTVEKGDTLDVLLEACGLARKEANQLVTDFSKTFNPRSLRPGQVLRYDRDADDRTQAVELLVSGWGSLRATRTAPDSETFEVEAIEAPHTSQEVVISNEVESSVWEAVVRAGEDPRIVADLIEVFQWDVDFFRLQRGDWFTLVAEKRFVGHDFVGYGPILAARFEHRGEVYEAFRFESKAGFGGYYTRNGTPVRKQFLKSPLKFSRVTSQFTHRRFHPVLKTYRPHYGVDYGAPTGTPVMSTADGVVTFAGRGRGEGNWIRIRHSSRTETAYLHLSRFAKGLKKGSKIQQGDVIGYVGSTGLSTAPHLDYRVRESGKWIDPLKLRSVTPDPLKGAALTSFHAAVEAKLPRLSTREQLVAAR